ncbi:helix-turn-helix domain-containing protein [Nocardioides sp. NPDC057772]|uniref:helix-turn-helix domain-containing protein n=1 Tax=Nocardioides sp. NPDC057772 TaxID=3346245 RepID=UPI0036721D2B
MSTDDNRVVLGKLEEVKPHSRWILGETLEVMLHNGVDRPADVAVWMKLPPSTAAYRVRLLRELLGPDLHDPALRLAMMRALRSALPRWRAEAAYAKRRRAKGNRDTCC